MGTAMEGLFIIFIMFGALAALLSKWASSPRLKGLLGERAVHKKLTTSLDDSKYIILHDVTLGTRRGTTQIDHIVVSSNGIFVIETKNMSGWIFGSEYDPQWTQTFYRRKRRFQNPLRQNHAHVKALQELLSLGSSQFHSMVVFAGDAKFKTRMPANVMKPDGLLAHIQSKKSQVFNFSDVKRIANSIESRRLTPGAETDAMHIESLRAKHDQATGVIEDARGLVRQGIQTLGVLKLAASLVVLLVFVLLAGKLFEGVGGVFGERYASPQVNTAGSLTTNSPKPLNFLSATRKNIEKPQEASLMCGYSTDTMRCACYDPKGGKVPMAFDECKALADKGTGISRR